METIPVESLKPDLTFTGDLLLDSSFVLLPHTTPVTDGLLKALKTWGYDNVICDGGISLGGDIGVSKNSDDGSNNSSSTTTVRESVKKAIENSQNVQIEDSDKARMEMVQSVYDEYMNYIESVFTHYATHKQINQEELSETVQELCIFIKDHRRYILRINPTTETCKKNFLVIHSMRTTVLAIAIAQQLHLPLSKIIELGVSCILHEIGMLRLPPQLYMTTKRLSVSERAQISKHTLFGYTIVKELEFPLVVQLAVLEHHEKENGTGYPRKLSSDKISSNAKIIAVACSYEAISSVRAYKEERTTFDALLEMIQNKNKQYDDAVLKALLYTVSLYPIGTYVYLSNRKVAIVVDSNPENPKCPVVQLLTEKDKDGSPKIIQTNGEISILRILSKSERKDILSILKDKYKNIEEAQKVTSQKEESPASKQLEPEPNPEPTNNVDFEEPAVNFDEPSVSFDEPAVSFDEPKPTFGEENDYDEPDDLPILKKKESSTQKKPASKDLDGTEEIDISFFN